MKFDEEQRAIAKSTDQFLLAFKIDGSCRADARERKIVDFSGPVPAEVRKEMMDLFNSWLKRKLI